MKLMNPLLLIPLLKDELTDADTVAEKALLIFLAAWALLLSTLVVGGVLTIVYNIFTNPSLFSNSWGVFDTLG